MARIELSNIGGGGTTLSLTTTGTSGAATLAGSVLNIPVYQGQLTLTTTGTSGAATLVGNTLNVPQYSGGGTPAGSAGQVQFNSTPAGSFAASANLAWDNTATQLNIGTPLTPTGTLNVRGGGTLTTVNLRLTNSGNTELLKVLDNGDVNIGTGFNWINSTGRLGIGSAAPTHTLYVVGTSRLGNVLVSSNNLTNTNNDIYLNLSNGVAISGTGGAITPSARLHVRGSNTSGGTNTLLVQNNRSPTPDDIYKIENNGKISYWATNTSAGTTGPQTIDRPSGTVNFAAGATSLVVTNSLCTTSSIVFATVRTNDATASIKNVVPGSGSFTINLSAAATAETSVGFFIIN